MKKPTVILVSTLLFILALFVFDSAQAEIAGTKGTSSDDSTGSVVQYPLPVRDGLHPCQYFCLAKVYLNDFRLEHAKSALQKLKQCKPTDETKQLISTIEKGYMPKYPVAPEALKELNRAADLCAAARMRDDSSLNEVKEIRNKLLKKYPNLEWGHYLLANVGHLVGNPESMSKVVKINPNNVEALYTLANQYRGKNWTLAYSYAKRIKELDPNYPNVDLEFYRKAAEGEAKQKAAEKNQKQKVINSQQMEAMMTRMMQKNKAVSAKTSRSKSHSLTKIINSMPKYIEKSYFFIDKKGNTVIRTGPNVKVGKKYSDGLLVVNSSEGRGSYRSCDIQYWDRKGDLVFSLDYGDASSSTEGLCAIQENDDIGRICWGFKNHLGKTVVKPQFSKVIPFQDGLAAVDFTTSRTMFMNSKWGFIDKNGSFKVEPIYDHCLPFTEGLAGVALNGKVGFVNKEGRFVIPPKYDFARPFSEGMATVVNWNSKKRTLDELYIDKNDKIAFSKEYKIPPGKNYLDYIGESNYLYPDQYDHQQDKRLKYRFDDYHDNLVARWKEIQPKVWKLGYFNREGKYAIPPIFDGGEAFSEGVAVIKSGKKFSFINTEGKRITQTLYSKVTDFSDGMAAVSLDGTRWGYIDKTGKEVIPCKYLEAEPFSEGLAKVGVAK